jgi:hypothetical protein
MLFLARLPAFRYFGVSTLGPSGYKSAKFIIELLNLTVMEFAVADSLIRSLYQCSQAISLQLSEFIRLHTHVIGEGFSKGVFWLNNHRTDVFYALERDCINGNTKPYVAGCGRAIVCDYNVPAKLSGCSIIGAALNGYRQRRRMGFEKEFASQDELLSCLMPQTQVNQHICDCRSRNYPSRHVRHCVSPLGISLAGSAWPCAEALASSSASASSYRPPDDVRILLVIVAELKLVQIQRQILFVHVMTRPDVMLNLIVRELFP